jgi:pimeloyl-ACP methyl ester carboxylesterase
MRDHGGVSHNAHRLEVEVAGGPLAAFELSDPADPSLPLVVAAHGITANSHAWRPVARALAGRARVVAPDMRGRGDSRALPGPYGMAAHAADLLSVLDHLGARRAVFVGHSLGAYMVARLAVDHPDRVTAAVLVDGGLTIPGTVDVDPQQFAEEFLGPALARLKMTFESREGYYDWWRAHPAFAGGAVADADLMAYADHDLIGEEPQLRSSVSEAAVRGDNADLFEMGAAAHRLTVPATLLCAPRGLLDQPSPMQPLGLVEEWAAEAPEQRLFQQVPDVNHYTITLGAAGAQAVSSAVSAAAPPLAATR